MNGKERENFGHKLPDQINFRGGVSLKELLPFVVRPLVKKWRASSVTPRYEKAIWLAEAMETEKFWLALNYHLASDESKRQSLGGVFTRQHGQRQVGPYSWSQVFSSLDHLLKKFDLRATEFLFRDFQPEDPNVRLRRVILTTRELALNKYPRLRRLYWENYEEVLNTYHFWRSLSVDLERLPGVVSYEAFFGIPESLLKQDVDGFTMVVDKTYLEASTRRDFLRLPARAREGVFFVQYWNLAQIVRDFFDRNVRDFLLAYQVQNKDLFLVTMINQAKMLLRGKVLPVNLVSELPPRMSLKQIEAILETDEFWKCLLEDLHNYVSSPGQTPTLAYFLCHYVRGENNLLPGRVGTYGRFLTVFTPSPDLKDFRKKAAEASKKFVFYLLWQFKPQKEAQTTVNHVKELLAEMFPQDCLYAALQGPEFWEQFRQDLRIISGQPNFYSFLRYFSPRNLSCEACRHQPATARYQRLLHRAYHEQKDFLAFLGQIGISEVVDYRDGLRELFWQMASTEDQKALLAAFPKDFDPEERRRLSNEATLLNRAKSVIRSLLASPNLKEKGVELYFEDENQAKVFREKLYSAARFFRRAVISDLDKRQLLVKLGRRSKFSTRERRRFEVQAEVLLHQGLEHKEIASKLGVNDHDIEYVAGKLRKQGKLGYRRKPIR